MKTKYLHTVVSPVISYKQLDVIASCLTFVFCFQAIYERLKNWEHSIQVKPWERERHRKRQREAVIPLDDQARFLKVSYFNRSNYSVICFKMHLKLYGHI